MIAPPRRLPQWVNSAVLFELFVRYEQGTLSRHLGRWLQDMLELSSDEMKQLGPQSP
jgi:hypothetical protein